MSRRALSGGRYNLKHFVTANPSQFAHNAFYGFNTDVVDIKCERTLKHRPVGGIMAEALRRGILAGAVTGIVEHRHSGLLLWSPRANPVACGF